MGKKPPAVVLLLLAAVAGSCKPPGDGARSGQATSPAGSSPVEVTLLESPQWIDHYSPERSDRGYNLALFNRHTPFLMDMTGEVVHTWPRVRASARARLLPTGHLAVITDRGHFKEFDWEGRQTWSFKSDRAAHMLHHDFDRLRNGNYLLLVHWPSKKADYLLEVDRSGEVVWRWNSHEVIQEDFQRSTRDRNWTHMNSVQELPPNKWFDQGHEAFRPGNILVSARNLNAVYIVARPGGEVVWRLAEGLDWQHEARMIPSTFPGAGNILLFNNGYHSVDRQSTIMELDPVERSVGWSYRSPNFFSSTGGTQQALRNGNVLVTSSQAGRVFEVTRQGEIVWQWVPPYRPMRVLRYRHDHCPQLEALGAPSEQSVERRDPEEYIDRGVYTFALTHDFRPAKTGNSKVTLLHKGSDCQRLRLPENAELTVGYGIEHRAQCDQSQGRAARFELSIRPVGTEAFESLLERTLGVDSFESSDGEEGVSLRRETFSLARLGNQAVEVCLTLASASGGPPAPCFVWEAPKLRRPALERTKVFQEEKSEELLEHERRQLEALGYVN